MPDDHQIHAIYHHIAARYRPRRMLAFINWLGVTERTRVLDVGGTAYNWQFAPVRPRVTIVNREPRHDDCPQWIEWIQWDALAMNVSREAVDVVFSNSVIEQVSDHPRFAAEILRFDRPYWVQTPNRYFRIEPHFLGLARAVLARLGGGPVYQARDHLGAAEARPARVYPRDAEGDSITLGRRDAPPVSRRDLGA